MAVVHHLVTHVDGRSKEFERPLDDVDGAIDACAEAARIGEQYLHQTGPGVRRLSSSASRRSSAAPTVMEESATLNAGNSAWPQ
jgi:hypothetical protein